MKPQNFDLFRLQLPVPLMKQSAGLIESHGPRFQAILLSLSRRRKQWPSATSATMSLRLFDSSLPAPAAPQLTFSGDHVQVTGAPEAFDVKFDANTGYFRGAFKDPANSATHHFGGVILQGLKTAQDTSSLMTTAEAFRCNWRNDDR